MAQTKRDSAGSPVLRTRAGEAPRKPRPAGAGESRWRELLELDATLHDERRVRLLTPEGRVLLHLRTAGPVPVTAVMAVAGVSYRGFYAVIERLRTAGLIATTRDPQDQRVRRLSLDPSAPLPLAER